MRNHLSEEEEVMSRVQTSMTVSSNQMGAIRGESWKSRQGSGVRVVGV